MSRVPRENLLDIYMNLTDDQLEGIRRQIAYVFEHMRQRCFPLPEHYPGFLRYDEESNRVYIVDYTFMTFTDPNDKLSRVIDKDSMEVAAFGVWKHRTPVVKGRDRTDPPPPEDNDDEEGDWDYRRMVEYEPPDEDTIGTFFLTEGWLWIWFEGMGDDDWLDQVYPPALWSSVIVV